MNSFPWSVSIGLGVVLMATLVAIYYIITLDQKEEYHATKEGPQSKDNQ